MDLSEEAFFVRPYSFHFMCVYMHFSLSFRGRSSPFLSRKSTISDKGGVPSSIQTSSHQSNSNGGVEVGAKRTSLSFYESSKPSSTRGQRVLRKRHEKSVLILVLIVFVFLVCHSFRLGVQTFQVCVLSVECAWRILIEETKQTNIKKRFQAEVGRNHYRDNFVNNIYGELLKFKRERVKT